MKKIVTALVVGIGLTLSGCPEGGAGGGATSGDTPNQTSGDTPATSDNGGATGGDAAPAASGKPDLSHVKVGQKYTYTMTNPGAPAMAMIYEVTEVGDNVVKYNQSTLMDMGSGLTPVGDPSEQKWEYTVPATTGDAPADTPKVETSREKVEVSGHSFDCLVTKMDNTKTWMSMTGNVPTFPGLIRSQVDGNTNMELTKIE